MRKQKNKRSISVRGVSSLITLMLIAGGIFLTSRSFLAEAATNATLNFQARLLTAAGSTVPDGQYNIEFKLYNAASSSGSTQGSCSGDSSCLWVETRTTTNKVRVVNGYLTVNLGSVTSFPAINWDQELWLGMNVGGTSTPGWDGEMTPRLKLTAVPYAFRAGQLVSQNGANINTVSFAPPTATRTITIPDESGTICLQLSSACGFLTTATADTNYIQNQNSSSQTANFRISGTGRADIALQAPAFDRSSSGTLTIGGTNATTIAVGSSSAAQTIAIGTSTGATGISIGTGVTSSNAATIMIGSTNAASSLTLRAGTGDILLSTSGVGSQVIVQSGTNAANAFQVQNSSGNAILSADTSGSQLILGLASTVSGKMLFQNATNANTIAIQSGTTTSSYTLTLPVALGSAGHCLKDSTGAGVLEFSSCGATGGTLQAAYDAGNTVNTTSARNFSINLADTATDSNFVVNMQCTTCSVAGGRFEIQNAGTPVFWLNPGSAAGQRGTATFKNSANDINAFQVQDSGGSTVLNVDTINDRVGIGTATPERPLHMAVNNTQTTAPMALLEQQGTGDVTLEFKSTAKSFIVGQDASDSNTFKVSSSTASSTATFGYTTPGTLINSGSNTITACNKFTTSAGGSVTSMAVYVDSVDPSSTTNKFQVAIYNDDGGSPSSPSTKVANSGAGTLTAANTWVTVPITASITASTTYWLCYQTNASAASFNNPKYDTNGTANQSAFQFGTYGTWNNSFGTVNGRNSIQFSLYANYTPVGAAYDSFSKSLLRLTDTGQAVFQNSDDTTTAFQIQNAAGAALFTADTLNNRLYVGPVAGSTTGHLLVLGNKTDSTDPTGVNGAMYYNSNTSKFRCYEGDIWVDCVGTGSLTSANTAASTAINTCTTACASFSTTAVIPANYCKPGRVIRIVASGTYSTVAATTPSLGFGIYYGTNPTTRGSNVLIGTASTATTASGASNQAWNLDYYINCFSTTSMNGQGMARVSTSATAASASSMSTTSSTTVATNTAKNIYLFPSWGTSAAGNTVNVQHFIVTGQ